MSDAGQVATVWTVLIPVLIGGALTFLGSTAGPIVSLWWTNRQENQKLRIKRFEEMVDVVYAHDRWLDIKRHERTIGAVSNTESSPLPKALSIAAIYFPNLLPAVTKVQTSARTYELWMFHAQVKRLEGKIAEINTDFSEAYQPYYDAFLEFHTTVTEYAEKAGGKV